MNYFTLALTSEGRLIKQATGEDVTAQVAKALETPNKAKTNLATYQIGIIADAVDNTAREARKWHTGIERDAQSFTKADKEALDRIYPDGSSEAIRISRLKNEIAVRQAELNGLLKKQDES